MKSNNYTNNNWLYFLAAVFFLVFSNVLQAANITVRADRNPVVLNEQFTLTFSADSTPAGDPDFSVLGGRFDIVRQGKSSSVQIINGDISQNIAWNLVLFPKKAGRVTIPAISFGSDQSESIVVNVLATPVISQGQAGQAQQDIIVEVEVEPKTAYVQQQIIYIQRLYFARKFFDNATLSTPQIKKGKVDLEKLGNGRQYTKMKNGREYEVIERRYAIFPIQSGKLEIAPTFFEGRLIENNRQQQNFGLFSRPTGRAVRRYSAPVSVEIKPQPTAYKGKHWLPAKNVTLHANWSTPPRQAKTGEPITLTLGIIANGLRAEQLPELQIDIPSGLKAYNDQPVLNNESNSDEIIGTRQEKIVVVAAQPGEFVIPEITLAWWDIKTSTQQVATIPAKTIKAEGGVITNTPIVQPLVTPVPLKANVPAAAQPLAPNLNGEVTEQAVTEPSDKQSIWFYLSLLLFFILAIVLYLLWRQSSNVRSPQLKQHAFPVSRSANEILQTIELHCGNSNYKKLRDALIEWGQVYLRLPNSNLQNIAEVVTSEALTLEVQQLMKALYASSPSDWNSAELCKQVREYRLPKQSSKEASRIASLYPE